MTPQPVKNLLASSLIALTSAACASAPPPAVSTQPQLPFEQKMGWILRLEEDRQLRTPVVEPPPAPVITTGRRGRTPVTPPPPPNPDLVFLLKDEEARIRRRAALAVGRTRLAEGAAPLIPVLA